MSSLKGIKPHLTPSKKNIKPDYDEVRGSSSSSRSIANIRHTNRSGEWIYELPWLASTLVEYSR